MIEFRTFGGVELRGAQGERLDSLAGQPKRLALLAFLCVAAPRRFHRRDTLTALFWPDSDQAHGRTSLRNTVHILRRALGPDAIVARGEEEISVDLDRVWCDAIAFQLAVETGRVEEAAPLYRGDFLAGFYIREAPEWERWLDGERARLRTLAARMARTLAERSETERNITRAVSWAQQAVELTGDDERAFRRLLELFERVDDRAGALHAYDALARRLRSEYGTEPAAETRALIERIRDKSRGGTERATSSRGPSTSASPTVASPVSTAGSIPVSTATSAFSLTGLPVLPGYSLEKELARGEIASVYLAHDLKHDRPVAIKMLRPELAAGLASGRFLTEIGLAARLRHPHIVPLYDSGAIAGVPYYVMPVASGQSLRERLRREGTIPVADALRILRGVAAALALAHRHQIVHCDVKPENILLEDGHALLADFGVARALAASRIGDSSVGVEKALGSPGYLAPEQLCDAPEIDARADVYALGVVAYEILTGTRPFAAASGQALVAAQLTAAPRPLNELRSDVPSWLSDLVARSLAIEPAARFRDGGEMLAILEAEAGGMQRTPVNRMSRLARRRVGIAAGITLSIGLVAALALARDEPTAHPSPSQYRIAVFPFRILGDTSWTFLNEGAMDLLSGALDGVGELRRVDPVALTGRMQREGVSEVDQDLARRISAELGAGRFVLGTVIGERDHANIAASLYDSGRDGEPIAAAQTTAERDSLSPRFMGLARNLLQHQRLGEGGRLSRIGSISAKSFPAAKAYFSGEAMLRRGVYDSAGRMYEEAIRDDSTFALAWYRLALARSMGASGDMLESIDAAMRHRAHLTERDRLLVESKHAALHGNGKLAEERALAAVTAYPDEVEAWSLLADIRWWYAWQLGRSPVAARQALERALALDPDARDPLHTLHIISLYERRYAEAASLARRAYSPDGPLAFNLTSASAVSAFADADTVAQRTVITKLGRSHEFVIFQSSAFVATNTDDIAGARRIAELMIESSSRSTTARARGHVMLALLELARGSRVSARREFDRAANLDKALPLTYEGIMAAIPQLRVGEGDMNAIRENVLRWQPAARSSDEILPWLILPGRLAPQLRGYVLGILAARLGDDEAALEYASALENANEPFDAAGLLPDLALEIRALVAAGTGDSSAALATLEKAKLGLRQHYQASSPLHVRPLGRFLRAEMLHALGRDKEALGWYSSLTSLSMIEFVFLAPAYLRMGEIHEKAGNSALAIEYYSRFVTRWKDCDPELRPLVDDARERLRRLSS